MDNDYINQIFNEDCMVGLDRIPDHSVDLVMMDPPYKLERIDGKGCFGSDNRDYYKTLEPIMDGISNEVLNKIVSKMKKINIYVWCNKAQILQYMNFFDQKKNIAVDVLTWHKTNPVPTCSNKYLSDTEYCLFFREKGVKLYGSYETKHKYYISSLNTDDKKLYGHPTIKPLEFVKNLIGNSVPPGEPSLVLDPFMGSGTTAVAAKELGCNYVGFEIDPEYYKIALGRAEGTVYNPIRTEPLSTKKFVKLDAWGF